VTTERDRYLATILFTDIVGSTERASELGDRRWQDLLREHDALVRKEIESHGGREVNTAGDGFLVTFEEPERAVRCAAAIRDAVGGLGLRIRCGLHAGEVQRAGEGIGGIGVHIAARVAARAGPDEVLVSRTVRDLVAGSGLAFADRGVHALKGVSGEWRLYALRRESEAEPASRSTRPWVGAGRRPVIASAVAAALIGLGALYVWGPRRPADPDAAGSGAPGSRSAGGAPSSVAVLPFVNESPDPGDDYFSDGLTEELISALSGIEGMRVPGRTSSFVFKDSVQDARRIGDVLGVGHVLEGSVRRSGEQLRIVARLVSTENGFGVWSETYDRKVEDALEIQAEIASAIAGALELELMDPASGMQLSGRTADPVAYDLYLRGLYFTHALSEEGVLRGITYLQRATEADPDFALAYAQLAIVYHALGNRFGAGQAEYLPRARVAAERAVELDDSLAESHLALAVSKAWWDRDYPGAEREFRRALDIKPNYAAAHHLYGLFLNVMLRPDEGIAAVRKAVSLDPLSNFYSAALGVAFGYADRYDESIAQFERTLEQEPDNARIWLYLGRMYLATERSSEAFAAFRRAELAPGQEGAKMTTLGHAYAVTGNRREAEALLAQIDSLDSSLYFRPTDRASVELALGYRDRALDRLEAAERERELDYLPFQLDWRLDPMRSDPRFRKIAERMGLPEGDRQGNR
jgi:TolB-like protein/class 3 adenylate cyclase/Tfp pilus assembly protein PilF